MNRFRRIATGFVAATALALGGIAATAPEASAAGSVKVTVKNDSRSQARAVVKEIRGGYVGTRGVSVAKGTKKSFYQNTTGGYWKTGCVLRVPGGFKATVYRTSLLGPINVRHITNRDWIDKNYRMKRGSCKGTWKVRLTKKYHYTT